ncbi:MAG: SLC13 family permease [Candidatus Heimdallarchaeaceae archaeon]
MSEGFHGILPEGLEVIATIIVVIIVLATIFLLMKEGIDATKITVTGAVVVSIVYLLLVNDWKKGFEVNLQWEEAQVPEHFLQALAKTVNVEAILIIFSVSIIVSLTKGAGFFDFVSLSMVKLTKGDPRKLIVSLGALTFFISMFFDNLSAIILLGSLTIVLCKQLELNPKPYILFVAINTIIGGLPTPISSLPNIIFYSLYLGKGVSFLIFIAYILPVAIFFFGISTAFFFFVYRKEIIKEVSEEKKEQLARINPWSGIENRKDIWKSIALLAIMFTGFLLTSIEIKSKTDPSVIVFKFPLDVAFIALIVALIGLFLFKKDLKDYIKEGIEWEMIIFFVALFVLMGVLTASGALSPLTELFRSLLKIDIETGKLKLGGQILVALLIGVVGFPMAGLLNSFSAALIFSYIFQSISIGYNSSLWIAFILSGNMGGALTPLGSITILMALEILNREGESMSFFQYIIKMLPLTLTLGILSIGYSILLILIFP